MRHPLFLAACALACLPLAAQETEEGKKVPTLPAFPDEGPVAFKVEGIAVPAATIERYADIMRARTPSLSEEAARRKAIEKGIIPQAAMYALHEEGVPDLSATAARIEARLKKGEDFGELAREFSDDISTRAQGGKLPHAYARVAMPGVGPLSPAMEEVVFSTEVGSWAGPFVSPVGVHFVEVLSEKPNADPRFVQREVAHILLHLDRDYARLSRSLDPQSPDAGVVAEIQARASTNRRATKKAQVEIVDEDFRSLVYPYRLARPKSDG